MMNLISGLSLWVSYGVVSFAGVYLCSRLDGEHKNKKKPESTQRA